MMKCVNCDQEIPGGTKFCPYCGAKQIIYVAPESAEQPLANERPESLEQTLVNERPDTPEYIPANEQAETLEQGAENESGQTPAEAAAQELMEEPAQEPSEKTEEVPAQEAAEEPAEVPEHKPVSAGPEIPSQPDRQSAQEQPAQKQPVYQYQQPQQLYQQVRTGETVNWVPYLVLSILSTVCCCVPFGIVAIVYAVKINSLVSEGKIDEARSAAKTARIWIIVAFAVGIIFDIVVKNGPAPLEAELEYGEIMEAMAHIDKEKYRRGHCHQSQRPLLHRIHHEPLNHQLGWLCQTSALYCELFFNLLREVAPASSQIRTPLGYKNIALTATKYIHANYTEDLNIDMVAKALNVTPRHINRLFQELFGSSFARTVSIIRMEYAKQHLISSNESIERIAARVGLPSGKVLSKLFHEQEGMSHAKYRSLHQHK